MNRNVESHFALLPRANIQRSIFDRSSSHKTSFNAGRLIPFYVDEVLPGDTFDVTTSKIIRAQTLLAPIMDDLYLDTYWFFVPNRLVWEHWEEFCGENKKGPWAQTVEYKVPKLLSPVGQDQNGQRVPYPFAPGTLADYFGLPVGSEVPTKSNYINNPRWNDATSSDLTLRRLVPSALPFRGYALICNNFFRDENLTSPLLVPLDDADQTGSNDDNDNLSSVACGGMPYKVAKYHDYFTSALPSPQKGKAVSLPIEFTNKVLEIPVQTSSTDLFSSGYTDGVKDGYINYSSNQYPLLIGVSNEPVDLGTNVSIQSFDIDYYLDGSGNQVNSATAGAGTAKSHNLRALTFANSEPSFDSSHPVISSDVADPTKTLGRPFAPLNLAATFKASDLFESTAITINNLRLAVAMQEFLEALARGGSRYGEMIASLFGVRNPDARLQQPEYLGGNRIPLNVTQVSNTSQTPTDPLGDVGAQSATSDVHSDFVKSFTEHGYLFGLCCVRYKHSYPDGLEKFWCRDSFTDFYNPKFANLGEVPVYQNEIYNPSALFDKKSFPNGVPVFGYQEIWADYRYKPDRVSGEMRPKFKQTLAFWHLSDNYAKAPTLSDEWIREDPKIVDRVLAVSSDVSNQFWADFYVSCKCTRAMPMYSIPALEPRF